MAVAVVEAAEAALVARIMATVDVRIDGKTLLCLVTVPWPVEQDSFDHLSPYAETLIHLSRSRAHGPLHVAVYSM